MKPRKRNTTPAQFLFLALTEPATAEARLAEFDADERLDLVATLMDHTVRAYFNGTEPSRWRRGSAVRKFTTLFGARHRHDIEAILDAPYNPDELPAVAATPDRHQLIIRMAACICSWRRWNTRKVDTHVNTMFASIALASRKR